MPIYDFMCGKCGALREALADWRSKDDLELVCSECGGVMRVAPVATIHLASGKSVHNRKTPSRVKACGHTHHCRCSIKLNGPNPFQREIDAALGGQAAEEAGS